ncbi:MAG TPA: Gfo/Idh/MocA family oxidoreductase, partial [Chloroflexota bacterium]
MALRVAIVGAGFMGGVHARAYAALPDVEVAAIVSRGSERGRALAAELGAAHLTELDRLLDDPTVSIVDVCYPTHAHEPIAVAALAAGKHVLVEKPLALSLEAAERILAAWRASGRMLMVGHVLRFWPEYVALAEVVASGRIGRPLGVNGYRLTSRPPDREVFMSPELTGGAVVDLQIHDHDQLNLHLGQPRAVYCQGRRGEAGGWDHALTTVTYDEAVGVVEASALLPDGYPFSMGLRVIGEDGTVEYSFRAGGVSVEMGRQAGTSLVVYAPNRPPEPVAAPLHDA